MIVLRSSSMVVALATCVVFLAGCAGGGRSVPAGSSASPGTKVQATFRIDYPKNAATANKRSAQYISPATTQMTLDIQQNGTSIGGYPQTVGLTPTSAGCTSTLVSTYCTLAIALYPGPYTATMTTADTNGNPLSSAQQIAFTIVSGANNTISLALSGIPHALQIVPGSRGMKGSGTSGMTLYGTTGQSVLVNVLDADGNIIVGPGAPSITASVMNGSGWSAAQNSVATPNLVAVSGPGTNGAVATIGVNATYSDGTCSLSGAVCATTVAVVNDIQTLFVANGTGSVTFYAPPYTGAATSITSGVSNPSSLLLDAAGNLFVSNHGNSSVTEYASPYSALQASVTTGVDTPYGIAFDSGGDLFVANFNPGAGSVSVYARPYTSAATTITNGVDIPYAVAVDSSGNLFVANQGNNTVTEYAPPYTSPPVATIGTGVSNPYALALDGAGNLFVANNYSGTVTVYAPPYTSVPTTITSGVSGPQALLLDGAGNLFVANEPVNTVTEYAPPYTGSPTAITSGVAQPWALALDGAGNLFVANYGGNTVTTYAPPYTGSPTATITSGVSEPYALLLTP